MDVERSGPGRLQFTSTAFALSAENNERQDSRRPCRDSKQASLEKKSEILLLEQLSLIIFYIRVIYIVKWYYRAISSHGTKYFASLVYPRIT
jgi:hypothetical protein